MKKNILLKTSFFIFIILFSTLIFSVPPPGFAEEMEAKESNKTLVTIDYKDASLSTVLRALSQAYNLNLVITKDVRGTVSTTLNKVTVDEALEAILSVNGYTFTRKGNLIYVTPGPGVDDIDQTVESLRLKYLTSIEAARLLERALSSKGDIQVNESTNSLLVSDYPDNVNKIKEILKDIDIPPTQVLIEAKLLDVQSQAFENLGHTTTLTYDPRGAGTDGGIFDRENIQFDESFVNTASLAGPSSNLSGGQWTMTTTVQNYTLSTTIDALIQENKAHLLAAPSITTLNGKEARIIIGEKFPFTEKTQTTTGTTETTKFVDVGTTLRVVPIVSPDGWITMTVHPEVSSVSAALDAGPRITTREADAVVRVKDGQTIIIGGLINKQDDRLESGIPYLRKIPILGKGFFSRKSADFQETELTVFITPRIVSSPDQIVSRSDVVDEEIVLKIDAIGESHLVAKLLEHAEGLEDEKSIQSKFRNPDQKKKELLNTYKMIVTNYPNHEKADKALYKVGSLYYNHYQDFEAANRAFDRLINEYPDSRYYRKAQNYLERSLEKRASRKSLLLEESSKDQM